MNKQPLILDDDQVLMFARPKRFSLIIFDLDGTLVDSRVDIVSSINHMLGGLDLEKKSFEEITSYIGFGVEKLVSDVLGPRHRNKWKRGLRIFNRYYMAHLYDNTILYPGVRNILKYLDRHKINIALLSNRQRGSTMALLRYFKIDKYFDTVLGGDNNDCMKPSACPVLNVLKTLKSEPDAALIVGDSYLDVQSGKRSGIASCGVTYGIGKARDIKRFRPDYIIDNILELKRIVQ
ncbi:MAG: hypothetical protein A2987_01265 [Omnitrophica bacterium RIFCSPLOWO2_01_FULL_45_10]|nr:MAG: hypothetical protein A2987_01265 [Omnitrophica bacterium RIFCSPLOWO2_01_FULL_45_10]